MQLPASIQHFAQAVRQRRVPWLSSGLLALATCSASAAPPVLAAAEPSSLESIYKMIGAERADFTLWSFNSQPGFEITVESVTLAPLPGIKVTMHGDRRFAVSKAYPDAQAILNALNKGLEILRSNGTIARAWRESAYINKRTESWTALN